MGCGRRWAIAAHACLLDRAGWRAAATAGCVLAGCSLRDALPADHLRCSGTSTASVVVKPKWGGL